MVEPDRPQMITRRMRFACWVTKLTGTHLQYVILIALPRQKYFRERALILRYKYFCAFVVTETKDVYCAVRAESLSK